MSFSHRRIILYLLDMEEQRGTGEKESTARAHHFIGTHGMHVCPRSAALLRSRNKANREDRCPFSSANFFIKTSFKTNSP